MGVTIVATKLLNMKKKGLVVRPSGAASLLDPTKLFLAGLCALSVRRSGLYRFPACAGTTVGFRIKSRNAPAYTLSYRLQKTEIAGDADLPTAAGHFHFIWSPNPLATLWVPT